MKTSLVVLLLSLAILSVWKPVLAQSEAEPGIETVTPSYIRRLFCDTFCLVVALSGDDGSSLPAYCSAVCPEYIVPAAYTSTEANFCTYCPSERCLQCNCDTGSCLVWQMTGPTQPRPEPGYCGGCDPEPTCQNFWWCEP